MANFERNGCELIRCKEKGLSFNFGAITSILERGTVNSGFSGGQGEISLEDCGCDIVFINL